MSKTDWKDIDGAVTAVTSEPTRGGTAYNVAFNYKVGDHWYGGYYSTSEPYSVGDSIAVRYDPKDPDRNDLNLQQARAPWIIAGIVVGVILVIVALAIVLH